MFYCFKLPRQTRPGRLEVRYLTENSRYPLSEKASGPTLQLEAPTIQNEKAISLILQYRTLEKLVIYSLIYSLWLATNVTVG